MPFSLIFLESFFFQCLWGQNTLDQLSNTKQSVFLGDYPYGKKGALATKLGISTNSVSNWS